MSELKGIDPGVLDALAVPTVIHFGGHMISAPGERGRFPAEAEGQVADAIADYLTQGAVGFGFGSLACGADILFAEALLASGAELHVVLPFAVEEFKAESVARGGPTWPARFDRCLVEATTVILRHDRCLPRGRLPLRLLRPHGHGPRPHTGRVPGRPRRAGGGLGRRPAAGGAGTASDVAVWQAARWANPCHPRG